MSELLSLLCGAITRKSHDDVVALLLSGGLDSVSVGLALQKAGKDIRAYTYHLQRYPSKDLKKSVAIARHFGWPLRVITIPTADVAADFLRLAVQQRCRKKTQFEVTFPLLYVFPQIDEAEVWTGWNADDHYGNGKNCAFRQRRLKLRGMSSAKRKEAFDAERRAHFEKELANPESGDTWWYAHRLAAQYGKRLCDPYLDAAIRDYFLRFDHQRLSPLNKPLVRQALAHELQHLPRGSLAVGVRLQTGGGVDSLFATLLQNRVANRFEQSYETISGLCQRWGREVSARPDPFQAELKALPPRSAAAHSSGTGEYQPYVMDDVREASAARKFTVMSMFAGGGGSCIGFHLAGGRVLLASEFVREAARTYAKNFPGTHIDARDIREIMADADAIKACLAQAGLRSGELDVLSGSPPCCEFSNAGKGLSDQHRLRPYSDTKQRGMATLIFDFFELARQVMPKVIVGENVPSLASSKNQMLFEGALDILRYAGPSRARLYYVNSTVLSSNGFGVPQERRRLFFLGVRKDVAEAVGINSDAGVSSLFPEASHLSVSIRSALDGLQQSEGEIYPWRRTAMTSSIGPVISRLPPNPRTLLRPRDVGLPKDTRFSLVRCAWDLPAPTLTVMGQRPDGLSGAIHPQADRKFTIPELKRLFGLPDDFVLTGTMGQAAERICRMVTPRVMQAIAERVYEQVLQPHAGGNRDRR